MFKRNKISSSVLAVMGGLQLAGTSPALAQVTERVEVTGSLIRKIDSETSLPTTTLKAEDLQRVGATNAEQVVKFITQNQSGTCLLYTSPSPRD